MKEFQHHGTHPQALLVNQIPNLQEKRYRRSTLFLFTSRKTDITKCARPDYNVFCRKRTGDAALRAENFGDLMTDHEVFNEGCESQNNHRCAVVVQDVASQWIPSHPCKTETSLETERSLRKFLEPSKSPKSFTLNFGEFGKILWRSIVGPFYINASLVLLRERHAGLKQELLLCCCNLAWMNNDGWVAWKVIVMCGTCKTSYHNSKVWFFRLVHWLNTILFPRKTTHSRLHKLGQKLLPGIFLEYGLNAGNLWRKHSDCRYWGIGSSDASEIYARDSTQWKSLRRKVVQTQYSRTQMEQAKLSGRDEGVRESTLLFARKINWNVFSRFLDLFSLFEFFICRRGNYLFPNNHSKNLCVRSWFTHKMWLYTYMCCGLFFTCVMIRCRHTVGRKKREIEREITPPLHTYRRTSQTDTHKQTKDKEVHHTSIPTVVVFLMNHYNLYVCFFF